MLNGRALAIVMSIAALGLLASVAHAAATSSSSSGTALGKAIGAGIAMGLSGIGAGIAVGRTGAAASAATVEKPEISGRLLIYLVLGEGIAIYGLVIAILILFSIK